MEIFATFKIAASAMQAQKTRLNIVSSNLANAETTSTPEGGPYKRKSIYFESKPISFANQLHNNMNNGLSGVRVAKIIEDNTPPQLIYNPSHPDANEKGFVAMPNINILKEMTDMMSATRSYEANTTAIKAAKRMAMKALEIGR